MTDHKLNGARRAGAPRLLLPNIDSVTRFSLQLSKLTLVLLFGTYIIEVMMRYFFNQPTTWAFDLSTWFLGVTITLALPEITRLKAHIAIVFLLEKLTGQAKVWAQRLIYLVCFFACAVTTWICANESLRQFQQGIQTNWHHPIPKWWVSVIIPVGFGLCSLIFLRQTLRPSSPDLS